MSERQTCTHTVSIVKHCYTTIRPSSFKRWRLLSGKKGPKVIKGSIHQEDKMIVSIYWSSKQTPKHIKQNLIVLKGNTKKSTTIGGSFNIPLSEIDRTN